MTALLRTQDSTLNPAPEGAVLPHVLAFGASHMPGLSFSECYLLDDFAPTGTAKYMLSEPIRAGEFIYLACYFDFDVTQLISPRCLVSRMSQPIALEDVATRDDSSTLEKVVPKSAGVADELKTIRELTALSVADIARLCRLKRRHLYNLLDGEATDPHRAARIRRLTARVTQWAKRFPTPETLRSALFTPLDDRLRDFVTIMSMDEPDAEDEAVRLFDAYLVKLGGGRPITRTASRSINEQRASLQYLRELYGETQSIPES